MKIKRLHLISFGKFKNKEILLDDTFNIIRGNNEAGKSTIALFIHFMLYGISSSRASKNAPVSEKDRFMPWDGETISGVMEISVEGKELIIEREFKKSSNKRLVVRSKATGEEIKDFYGTEIGEQLFNVKSDTFIKTAFIKQNDIEMEKAEELEVKLRNLASGGQEDISFENAAKQLEAGLRKLIASKGLMNETEKRLYELDVELSNAENTYSRWVKAQNELNEMMAYEKKLGEDLAVLQGEYAGIKAYNAKEKLSKVKECGITINEYENSIKALEERLTYNDFVPDEAYIGTIRKCLQDFVIAKEKCSFSEEDLSKAQKRVAEKADLAGKYDKISGDFEGILEKLREKEGKSKRGFLLSAGLAFVTVVFLIAYFVLNIGFLPLLAAVLLFVSSGVAFLNGKKNNANKFLNSLGFLTKEKLFLAMEEFKSLKIETSLARQAVEEAIKKQKEQKWEFDRINLALGALCAKMGLEQISVSSVQMLCEETEAIWKRVAELKAQIDAFKAKRQGLLQGTTLEELNSLSLENGDFSAKPIAEIEVQLNEVSKALSQTRVNIANQSNRVNSFFEGAKTPDEIRTNSNVLKEQRGVYLANKAALEIALGALKDSFLELRSIFAPELNEKASELFSLMTGREHESIRISSENAVSIKDGGIMRELAFFSKGTNDAAYLCVRLAVAKLIYKESPPLIFDDTFSHFDMERLENAMEAIFGLSGGFQIILLSCRENEEKIAYHKANVIAI